MRPHAIVGRILFVAAVLAWSSTALAQSAISGVVRDASGAVLPGVVIEASSPALIEKTRTAVSDSGGLFTIVDLRPGTYTVTFSLPGFNALRREGVELPSNFTATINADLRVGALEESITVTGSAPVVDVQSTQRTYVLNREALDSLPTARNYSGLAALMPGVRMSNTDVGGNQQMEQIYMTVHGSRQTDTTVQVDGMNLNSLMNDGQVQAYFSDAANAEVSYQTSGIGADVSGGGVRINMIPKEGGNTLSGSLFLGGTDGSWQGDNVTDELRARGLRQGSKVDRISDVNVALGGPIKRDALWFFVTWRRIATDSIIANNFYKDGRPGVEDQWVQNQMVRLTWQFSPRNKFTAYHDRYPKFKGHEMGALTDPETAARRRNPENALYYTSQAKWTSVMTSRLLLEAGFATNSEYYTARYQPGIQKERGSPEWYTQIGKNDLVLLTNYDGIVSPTAGIDPKKWVLSSTASYVTGSHSFKLGAQWGFGDYQTERDINGDLVQLYRNGVPDSVRVYNTPVRAKEFLNADLGVFAQDSWRLDRLTVNAGVRLEYFNGTISTQEIGSGRFAPVRNFPAVPDMPKWFDVAPRFGVAYDVFGNARTALKATFSRYMRGQTLGFAQRYNPLQLQSDTRTWNDLNRDNVAQDNEIGPSNNAAFGLPVTTIRPDDDIEREYHPRVQRRRAAPAQARLRGDRRVVPARHLRWRRTDNLPVSIGDYTLVNVVSPLNGEVIPAYNLNVAKRGLVDQVDVTSNDSELRRRTYNGVELGFNARLGRASMFGGWTADRLINVECDSRSDPNALRFCDQSALGMPLRHEFKVAGSYRFPWDIQANLAYQSYAGRELPTNWNISRTTRYAADCAAPCTPGALVIPNLTPASLVLALVAPGAQYDGQLHQVDIGVRKMFKVGIYQFSAQADVFNALNVSYVKTQNTTFGSSLGQPLDVLQPRLLRLALQMKF